MLRGADPWAGLCEDSNASRLDWRHPSVDFPNAKLFPIAIKALVTDVKNNAILNIQLVTLFKVYPLLFTYITLRKTEFEYVIFFIQKTLNIYTYLKIGKTHRWLKWSEIWNNCLFSMLLARHSRIYIFN